MDEGLFQNCNKKTQGSRCLIMKQLVALLTVVFSLLMASAAYSQSLSDLADKEKARREAIKGNSKVITNEGTTKYSGGAVTTGEPTSPPASKSDSEKQGVEASPQTHADKTDPDEPVDFQGRPESYWRKTMAEARQAVKDLENESNVIILKLNSLQDQFYKMDDGFKRETIQRDIQKTFYEQDLNKENLAKAKNALQDLENEARKSGALPGWLTPSNQ
jgi:hypothetical protein